MPPPPPIFNPPKSGKNRGCMGASPPCGGWGMCPQKNKSPPPFPAAQPGFRGPLVGGFQEVPARPPFCFRGGTPPTSPRQGDSIPLHSLFPLLRGWKGLRPLPEVGGVPQRNQLKGREGNSRNPPASGTLNFGEPPASEGGEKSEVQVDEATMPGGGGCAPGKNKSRGWRGRSPIPGGVGGVPPKKPIKGARRQLPQPAREGAL